MLEEATCSPKGNVILIAPCFTLHSFSADFGHFTYANGEVVGNELQLVPHQFPQPLFTWANLASLPAQKSSGL